MGVHREWSGLRWLVVNCLHNQSVGLESAEDYMFHIMAWALQPKKKKKESLKHAVQGRNQVSYLGGPKLKTEKKFMKIKTNIYFIFNKILHTKLVFLKHFIL